MGAFDDISLRRDAYRPNFTMPGVDTPGTSLATTSAPSAGPSAAVQARPNFTMPSGAADGEVLGTGNSVRSAATGAADVSNATLSGNAARAGRIVGRTARLAGAFAPAAAGADVVSHFNDYKIDDPSVDSSAKGTWNALRRGDFSGAGQSLSKGALEAGMDLGSAAANVADLVVPGTAPVSRAYDGMLRNTFGSQLKANVSPSQNTAPAPAPYTPSAAAFNPNARLQRQGASGNPGNPDASAPAQSPFGTYEKAQPVDYSTVDKGAEAQRVAESRARFENEKALGDKMESDRLSQEAAGRAAQDAQSLRNGAAQKVVDDERTRQRANSTLSSIMNTPAARAQKAAALKTLDALDSQTLEGQKQSGENLRSGQRIRADQQIAGMRNATELRGQGLTYDAAMAGHNATRAGNYARLQYEMGKDQRDFQAGRQDANFNQSEAAQKAADARIDSRFVDPATGKTDAAAATSYKQFVNNGIADEMSRLKASKNPADQAAAAKLAGRTYADLDPEDHLAMEKLWANRGAAQKANGWTPGSGNFVDSLRPKDWVPTGVDGRTFGGDHVQFANGSHASVNDLTGSGTMNLFPKATASYDDTIREARKAQQLRSK